MYNESIILIYNPDISSAGLFKGIKKGSLNHDGSISFILFSCAKVLDITASFFMLHMLVRYFYNSSNAYALHFQLQTIAVKEGAYKIVSGTKQQIFGRADLLHGSLIKQAELIAHLEGFEYVVRYEHNGFINLLENKTNFLANLSLGDGIEGAKGFIHQNNGRIGGQRSRQPYSLLLASAE